MDGHDGRTDERKSGAHVVNANRITVALPFSKIVLEEPSEQLKDLVAVVADLADAQESTVGDDGSAELRLRARDLSHRLHG